MGTSDVILDALLRVVIARGMDEVSVRHVAAEASVSVGAVQHHFRTKNELVLAAMNRVTTLFRLRVKVLIGDQTGPREALRLYCHLLGAAIDDDATASVVWIWFVAKATSDPQIAEAHQTAWNEVESRIRSALASLHPDGRQLDDDAASLLALLDGIAIARAGEPLRMPAARARRLIDRHLQQIEQRISAPPDHERHPKQT